MYIVTIRNGDQAVEVHNHKHKLSSGNVVKGINSIDSFSFTATAKNPAFNNLHEFLTLVEVYNTRRRRYEFQGRVLSAIPSMNDKGLLLQEATCESFFGYLCDSEQLYVAERYWTRKSLLESIINVHNSMVESYKTFKIGVVDNPNTTIYCGIQRENSWETIKKKLIESEGGEIRFRVLEDGIYIDYLTQIGEEKTTEIAVSKNMKTIIEEKDPSAFITRLIPLGCKLKTTDEEGNETDSEQRLDISSVNNGKIYIDDEAGIEMYGVHVGSVEFDDVTDALNLRSKGREWMRNNNKVRVKYSLTALDLSLLGLDPDDFEVHNSYPVKNKFLNINAVARVTKKNIDICDETKTTMEIGESFKTLSQLQREQYKNLSAINADIVEIRRNYVTGQQLKSEISKTVSIIDQRSESIVLAVSAGTINPEDYESFDKAAEAAFALKVGKTDNDQIVSMLNASASEINIKAGRVFNISSDKLVINCTNFKLSEGGVMNCTAGKIGNWSIIDGALSHSDPNTWAEITISPTALYTKRYLDGGLDYETFSVDWADIASLVYALKDYKAKLKNMVSSNGLTSSYEIDTYGTYGGKLSFTFKNGLLVSAVHI